MSEFLDKLTSDRRRFVQRILGTAGFAVPTVRSFLIAAAATETVSAVPTASTSAPTTGSTTSATTTSATTTSATTTSVPTTAPTTAATTLATTAATTAGTSTAGTTQGQAVPEIDPGSAATALTVLAGAVLIVRDRLASKDESGPEKPAGE